MRKANFASFPSNSPGKARAVFKLHLGVKSQGIIVTSTVFKIEPIAFQQNMQIEHGYQTAISDFDFFEMLTDGENNHHFFKKISRFFFEFSKKQNTCIIKLADEYLCVQNFKLLS